MHWKLLHSKIKENKGYFILIKSFLDGLPSENWQLQHQTSAHSNSCLRLSFEGIFENISCFDKNIGFRTHIFLLHQDLLFLSTQYRQGTSFQISEMYLKCDADTVENLRGWIKREFEIQAGQTGREIVGFTPRPLFISPCFIFENSSIFLFNNTLQGLYEKLRKFVQKDSNEEEGGDILLSQGRRRFETSVFFFCKN